MTVNQPTSNKNKRIWIGLGAALLFCCFAGLVAVLILRQVGKQFQQGMKTDPESAAKAAHAIADYDLPAGYQEQGAMNILFYSFVIIAPVKTGSASDQPIIMLAQFKQAGVDQKQMEEQMRRSFEQQSGERGLSMKLVKVENKVIRGEEVAVATYEGTDSNGAVFRQVITTFPGKDGTAMLMIMGSARSWDEDLINNFIESIR